VVSLISPVRYILDIAYGQVSSRPFPLDAPASRPEAPLRLHVRIILIILGSLAIAMLLLTALETPEWRMVLLGAVLTLSGYLVLLAGSVGLYEWGRRVREDRRGFQEFVEAGGPHRFPAMLAAFEGRTPEHRKLQPPPSRAEVVSIGQLKVISGDVVLADPAFLPFADDLAAPFDEKVPPGEWPVDAVVLHYADGGRRIGALRVCWDTAEPSHFIVAWPAGARAAARRTRRLPRIGVDSGMACLASVEARDALNARRPQQFWEFVSRCWPAAKVRFADGANVLVCQAGMGEGDYPCFFAKAADGRSTALYVDFGLIGVEQRLAVGQLPGEPQRHLQAAAGSGGVGQSEQRTGQVPEIIASGGEKRDIEDIEEIGADL
jgi:hypothetical protein